MNKLGPGLGSEHLEVGSGFFVHHGEVVATFPFEETIIQRVSKLAGDPKKFVAIAGQVFDAARERRAAEIAEGQKQTPRNLSVRGARVCLGGSYSNARPDSEQLGTVSVTVSHTRALVKPGRDVVKAPIELGKLEGQGIVPYRGIQVLDGGCYMQMETVATHFAELFETELTRLETAPPAEEPVL